MIIHLLIVIILILVIAILLPLASPSIKAFLSLLIKPLKNLGLLIIFIGIVEIFKSLAGSFYEPFSLTDIYWILGVTVIYTLWRRSVINKNVKIIQNGGGSDGGYRYLCDIPDKYITEELCLKAIKNNYVCNMNYIPKKFKTIEFYLKVLDIFPTGFLLQYIPENLKTPELCFKAVENSYYALPYVPENQMEELCMKALEKDAWALEFVPDKLKTLELCNSIIDRNEKVLQFIPERFQKQLCHRAVEKYICALEYVPENCKTFDLCLKAIGLYGAALEFVPEQLKTQELCFIAVANCSKAIEYTPDKFKSSELLSIASENNEAQIRSEHFIKILQIRKAMLVGEKCIGYHSNKVIFDAQNKCVNDAVQKVWFIKLLKYIEIILPDVILDVFQISKLKVLLSTISFKRVNKFIGNSLQSRSNYEDALRKIG